MKKLSIYFIAVALFWACTQEDQVNVDDQSSGNAPGKQIEKMPEAALDAIQKLSPGIGSYAPKFPEGVDPQAFDEQHQLRRKHFELTRLVKEHQDAGWEAVQKSIRQHIEKIRNEETAFFFDQAEALKMIEALVEEQALSGKGLEELAAYTQKLLDYNYYHAHPVAESLKKLEGYWSREQIRNAARDAFQWAAEFQQVKKKALEEAAAEGRLSAARSNAKKPAWEVVQEKSMAELQTLAR